MKYIYHWIYYITLGNMQTRPLRINKKNYLSNSNSNA